MAASDEKLNEALAPIYLELGKALYICQCFESSLCFLLSQIAHESADGESGAFQASWDFHSKKTLGQLLKALRERIVVPDKLDEYLGVGVDKRNEIVHGFLTKNVARLYDPKGRFDVENELVQLKLEVKQRDKVVNQLLDALLEKYGLSNKLLKQNADRLWEHLNPDEPSGPTSTSH